MGTRSKRGAGGGGGAGTRRARNGAGGSGNEVSRLSSAELQIRREQPHRVLVVWAALLPYLQGCGQEGGGYQGALRRGGGEVQAAHERVVLVF